MNPDKMHERVLEIQKNLETTSPEEQTKMMSELLDIASKIEQSLAEIKIEEEFDDSIQIENENKDEE